MRRDLPVTRTWLERFKLELTPPLVWTGALPLAILLFSFFTLAWHWQNKCSSYGFPLPYLDWAGSSLEWKIALPAMIFDFAFYLLLAGLILTPARERILDDRVVTRKVSFGIFATLVYTFVLVPPALGFFSGMIEVVFWIDFQPLITAELWLGSPEYCANEGMKF